MSFDTALPQLAGIEKALFMENIRAWFVTDLLPPEYSGSGRNDSVLAVSCADQSIKVTFLALRSRKIDKPSSIAGVPVYWLPAGRSKVTKISRLVRTIHAFGVLEAPNVIRMRAFSLERALLLLLLKWIRPHIPIVVQPAMLGSDDPETLSNRPFGRFQVRMLLKADAIFAMNAEIARQLSKKGYPKEAIYRTRNPVSGKYFLAAPSVHRCSARKSLGISDDAVVVATVGVILPRKRQAFVTEGFCRALEQGGSEHTVLVHIGPRFTDSFTDGTPHHVRGSQSEEQSVADIVHRFGCSGRVSLLGEREDLPAMLGAVDVFVHASREEGEANVVNEAAAAGVAVVIPTSSIYDDQVPEGYPWRFDVDSTSDLATMLARLMTDSSLRAEAGRALQEHARQTRSEQAVGKKYAEMLRAVVERQGRAGRGGRSQ